MAIKKGTGARGFIHQIPEKTQTTGRPAKQGKTKRTYEIDDRIPRELKIISAFTGEQINHIVERALLDFIKKHNTQK